MGCSWLQTLSLYLSACLSLPDSLCIRHEVQLMTLSAGYIMAVGGVKQQSVNKSHRIIDSKNLNPWMKHKLSQYQFETNDLCEWFTASLITWVVLKWISVLNQLVGWNESMTHSKRSTCCCSKYQQVCDYLQPSQRSGNIWSINTLS